MGRAFIVERGKCVISGGSDGPVIDTGARFEDQRSGRIYVAFRSLAQFFRQEGWMDPKQADVLHDLVDDQARALSVAQEELAQFGSLEEAVKRFSRTETVEVPVETIVQRAPTDAEIEAWLRKNPDRLRTLKLSDIEKGSQAEWNEVYAAQNDARKDAARAKRNAKANRALRDSAARNKAVGSPDPVKADPSSEPVGNDDPAAPPSVFHLNGTDVNIDDLLANRVKTVIEFIDGHDSEFQAAVLARELFLAQTNDKQPRATLVKAVSATINDEDSDDE